MYQRAQSSNVYRYWNTFYLPVSTDSSHRRAKAAPAGEVGDRVGVAGVGDGEMNAGVDGVIVVVVVVPWTCSTSCCWAVGMFRLFLE